MNMELEGCIIYTEHKRILSKFGNKLYHQNSKWQEGLSIVLDVYIISSEKKILITYSLGLTFFRCQL
jgi:hypothetical protein